MLEEGQKKKYERFSSGWMNAESCAEAVLIFDDVPPRTRPEMEEVRSYALWSVIERSNTWVHVDAET